MAMPEMVKGTISPFTLEMRQHSTPGASGPQEVQATPGRRNGRMPRWPEKRSTYCDGLQGYRSLNYSRLRTADGLRGCQGCLTGPCAPGTLRSQDVENLSGGFCDGVDERVLEIEDSETWQYVGNPLLQLGQVAPA